MKCSTCDARVSRRAKFCSTCGNSIRDVVETSTDDGELKTYAKELAAEGELAVGEMKDAAIKGLKSETGKSMLVWGAFGAVAGAALPFVTPLVIGALGAGYGALKKFK
jgi:hypothetical protein